MNLKPSELLRRLVNAELGLGNEPDPSPPAATVKGVKIRKCTFRLPLFVFDEVAVRAKAKSMAPSRWIASLVQCNVLQEPVITDTEIVAVRAMTRELAAIGRNVNQIAKSLNSAVHGIERGQVALDALEKVPAAIAVSRKTISNLIRKSQQSWVVEDDDV